MLCESFHSEAEARICAYCLANRSPYSYYSEDDGTEEESGTEEEQIYGEETKEKPVLRELPKTSGPSSSTGVPLGWWGSKKP